MIYYIFTGVLDILNSSHEIMVPKCTHTILLCQNVYGFKTGHDKYQKIKNFEPGTDIKYVHNLATQCTHMGLHFGKKKNLNNLNFSELIWKFKLFPIFVYNISSM